MYEADFFSLIIIIIIIISCVFKKHLDRCVEEPLLYRSPRSGSLNQHGTDVFLAGAARAAAAEEVPRDCSASRALVNSTVNNN